MESFSWQAKDANGDKRIYEATHFGGWWQLESMPKLGRAHWGEIEMEPTEFETEQWEALRDILKRKYQRRRLSFALLEHVDGILAGTASNVRRDQRPDLTPQGHARDCRPDRPGRPDRPNRRRRQQIKGAE